MRLRVGLEQWTVGLLGALGLAPVACGGEVTGSRQEGGGGDDGAGGSASTGGRSDGAGGAVGASAGGARTGSAGGSPSRSGGAPAADGGAVGRSSGGARGPDAGPDDAGGDVAPGTGGRRGDAAADVTATPPFPCVDPVPVPGATGEDTGYTACAGGWVHRPTSGDCTSTVPRVEACPGVGGGDCTTDADCSGVPLGHCALQVLSGTCHCVGGCMRDADCGEGRACLCGAPAGRCVRASCSADADCASGLLCASYQDLCGYEVAGFACQSFADECMGADSCTCTYTGRRVCEGVDCGRPFLVGGSPRVASSEPRADWSAALRPDLEVLSPGVRAVLGAWWTEIGLLEHASVAAFARFSLQLLALGAPPDLLRDAQRAMGDETHHARLAFGLAGAYLGRPVGPGALIVRGALAEMSAGEVARTTFLEGCIGETVAAVEAAEALECATDPVVRGALSRIAADESRHAELAWRAVRWILLSAAPAEGQAIGHMLETALNEARAEGTSPSRAAGDAPLLSHGFLPADHRDEVRRRVLAEVVAPCLGAILRASGDEVPAPRRASLAPADRRMRAPGIGRD